MDIIALIEALGVRYEIKGDEIAVTCPNAGNHQGGYDSKPSFNINPDKLFGHCLSCNFTLTAGNLLSWLNGGDLDDLQMHVLGLRSKLTRLRQGQNQPLKQETPEIFFPPGRGWDEDGFRGISLETYKKLFAVKVERGRYANRIAFPIYVNGVLKGVDARTLVGDEPKYLRNKGSSCKTDWLYPYDIVKAAKPDLLLLGEGIFHSINAKDKVFQALTYFGVNNWSDTKLRMILATGCSEVIYFRDNDKAGKVAEQVICSQLKDWIKVSSAEVDFLPEGIDLGDMSKAQIEIAVRLRKPPELPLCLPGKKKIEPLTKCGLRKCPYNIGGICGNIVWGKS